MTDDRQSALLGFAAVVSLRPLANQSGRTTPPFSFFIQPIEQQFSTWSCMGCLHASREALFAHVCACFPFRAPGHFVKAPLRNCVRNLAVDTTPCCNRPMSTRVELHRVWSFGKMTFWTDSAWPSAANHVDGMQVGPGKSNLIQQELKCRYSNLLAGLCFLAGGIRQEHHSRGSPQRAAANRLIEGQTAAG